VLIWDGDRAVPDRTRPWPDWRRSGSRVTWR